jgi:signal transduction histidine kinase
MHGKAKNVEVKLAWQEENIVLRIKDDGAGLSHNAEGKNGKGLRIMKHRVDLMGGCLKLKTGRKTAMRRGRFYAV